MGGGGGGLFDLFLSSYQQSAPAFQAFYPQVFRKIPLPFLPQPNYVGGGGADNTEENTPAAAVSKGYQ